jgi:hypothetical protein
MYSSQGDLISLSLSLFGKFIEVVFFVLEYTLYCFVYFLISLVHDFALFILRLPPIVLGGI